MKIQNPQKECKETPKKFRGESKIIRVEKEDYRSGIILDSPEEFVNALIAYNSGSIEGSKATEDNLMTAAVEDHGPLAGGLIAMVGVMKGEGVMEELKKDALSKLKKDGFFRKDFDYDGLGTNFFKTSIKGDKIKTYQGDKYILELCAAYVGDEPEKSLAETLGKQRALIRSSAKGRLNIVDDWWFNVNLENLLKNLPVPTDWNKRNYKITIRDWAKYLGGSSGGKKPKFEFKHKNKRFLLEVGLDSNRYLRPKGFKFDNDKDYLQARDNSIVGGAWTIWDETGNNKIEPKATNPSIIFSVSLPGGYFGTPAVISPHMKSLQNARDYIAEIITPN